jgi:hypothetical protein
MAEDLVAPETNGSSRHMCMMARVFAYRACCKLLKRPATQYPVSVPDNVKIPKRLL